MKYPIEQNTVEEDDGRLSATVRTGLTILPWPIEDDTKFYPSAVH